jgi:predicted Zn-dependent protease
LLSFALSCSTSPLGRPQLTAVSTKRVDDFGNKAFERLKRRERTFNDPEANRFVACVVSALELQVEPQNKWEAVIFQNSEANAFALPGRKIGINSGLLRVTVNQDQLAAVIGHEMGHVLAQHGREKVSQQTALGAVDQVLGIFTRGNRQAEALAHLVEGVVQIGILYPFSRVQEDEADLIGLELMAKAGFHPTEAVEFWKNMSVYSGDGSSSSLSTHSPNQIRIEKLQKNIQELKLQGHPKEGSNKCEI